MGHGVRPNGRSAERRRPLRRRPVRFATLVAFDHSRNRRMIDILRPIYAGRRLTVPPDLNAEASATNEFLDPSIRMGGA